MGLMKRLAAGGGARRSGRSFFEVDFFFDKVAVIRSLDDAARRVLSRFGAFVRSTARQSIRRPRRKPRDEMKSYDYAEEARTGKRPFAPSRPGEPPRNRTGLLKDNILFWYDLRERSVTIGPAAFDTKDTPGVIEHGGRIVAGPARGKSMDERPFMGPALERELPKLMPMWHDSVRGMGVKGSV